MTAFREVAAAAIFLTVIAAVITRPRNLNEGAAAVLGALAMLGLGVLSPSQALATVAGQWDLFLFFAGLMVVAGLADVAGFFDAAAALAIGAARGSGRLLLVSPISLMRILAGIAERGGPDLLAELDGLLPLHGNELVLVHVVDNGARGELERTRGRVHPPRPLPPHRLRVIGEAERQAAAAALEEASDAARSRGSAVQTIATEGEPGRQLARLAQELGCRLVVMGARVDRRREVPGPHSVGHTARFVLDHSPCPVLLLRGRVAD